MSAKKGWIRSARMFRLAYWFFRMQTIDRKGTEKSRIAMRFIDRFVLSFRWTIELDSEDAGVIIDAFVALHREQQHTQTAESYLLPTDDSFCNFLSGLLQFNRNNGK